MGYQSWVIGAMFGMAYQGYKRKMSAMSNAEFNKLNLTDFGLNEMRDMVHRTPKMEAMFAEMRPMLEIMAEELGRLFDKIPDYITAVVNPNDPVTDTGNLDLPTNPTPPQGALKFGVLGFITPFLGPSNTLQNIANIPPSVVQRILNTPEENLSDINKKRLAKWKSQLRANAFARFDARKEEIEINKIGSQLKFLMVHGYNPNKSPRLIPGASSRRKKSQSSDIELSKLGARYIQQLKVARELATIVMRLPSAESGKQRYNLRHVVIPLLQKFLDAWKNHAYTYV